MLAAGASGLIFLSLLSSGCSSASREVGSQSTGPSSPCADGVWLREQERGPYNITWEWDLMQTQTGCRKDGPVRDLVPTEVLRR